ncbi:MAG: hypothetical protein IGQ88_08180 [Gloeomargaritaceae cyanobacterium C42_A2020_066]|nr:hypothetical protein [Gloeomargaritaceae cyanobacterium C42_A2020_066]
MRKHIAEAVNLLLTGAVLAGVAYGGLWAYRNFNMTEQDGKPPGPDKGITNLIDERVPK